MLTCLVHALYHFLLSFYHNTLLFTGFIFSYFLDGIYCFNTDTSDYNILKRSYDVDWASESFQLKSILGMKYWNRGCELNWNLTSASKVFNSLRPSDTKNGAKGLCVEILKPSVLAVLHCQLLFRRLTLTALMASRLWDSYLYLLGVTFITISLGLCWGAYGA